MQPRMFYIGPTTGIYTDGQGMCWHISHFSNGRIIANEATVDKSDGRQIVLQGQHMNTGWVIIRAEINKVIMA